MFSGIVSPGRVERIEKRGEDVRLYINLGPLATEVRIGDSIAVSGVCLTVIEIVGSIVGFDVMPETQDRTTIGSLNPLDPVNIELSLQPTDRLGGHFVLGHVDGTGRLISREDDGRYTKLWFSAPPQLLKQMVQKGAIALDGVSMTLVDVDIDRFSVCMIPHTAKVTTLGYKSAGSGVNVEIDMLGKYVRTYLDNLIFQGQRTIAPASDLEEHVRQRLSE